MPKEVGEQILTIELYPYNLLILAQEEMEKNAMCSRPYHGLKREFLYLLRSSKRTALNSYALGSVFQLPRNAGVVDETSVNVSSLERLAL